MSAWARAVCLTLPLASGLACLITGCTDDPVARAAPVDLAQAVGGNVHKVAFIETAFLPAPQHTRQHLTERDRLAYNLLDLFDFIHAPSLGTAVGLAAPPLADCTRLQ